MGSQMPEERMLHATLCEVERGLFHVFYRMEGAGLGKHRLPGWSDHGTDADDPVTNSTWTAPVLSRSSRAR